MKIRKYNVNGMISDNKFKNKTDIMTKFFISIFLTILSTTSFIAQNDPLEAINFAMLIQKDTEKEIVGSPYYEQTFIPGIINEVDGKKQEAYFRYNVKDDQVEVKFSPNQEETYLLPRDQKYIYQLKDYSYVLGSFNAEKAGLLKGFVIEYVQNDKVTFIGKPFVNLIQAQAAKTGYGIATPASLNVGINYYFGLGDGKLQEVKLKEKEFRNIVPSSKEMKKYFEENKIENSKDVIKMIEFYETLNP
jgi:hypothetical protein